MLNRSFIIYLNNVSVKIQGRTLLSCINWQIKSGENWAVLGGNGAGKSTLLRLVRGELWPDAGSGGKRLYKFESETQDSPLGIRKRIALLSAELQDAYHSNQWDMSGREVVYTGFFDSAWLHQEPTEEQKDAAEQLLHELKLYHLGGKNFLEMSQGEARKILVARALVSRPAILALDEPCDGLDLSSRRQFLHMVETVASSGISVLYATHRIAELIPSITHVLKISKGKIIKQGRKDDVLKKEGLNKTLSQAAKRNPQSTGSPSKKGRPLITIKHCDVFLDQKKILSHLDWVMRRREHWLIIGRNGAGKSTLLKLIAGDIYPALGGEINRFGEKGPGSLRDLQSRIGLVSPEPQRDYSYDIKGADAVVSGFFSSIGLYDKITPGQREKALHWIDFFDLQHLSEKSMSEMSYGEQRKILIARAMVNNPDILILDEPCSGLDSQSRTHFLSFLEQTAQSGVSLILATHHLDEMPHAITHIMAINEGRIIMQGKKEEIMQKNISALFLGND
ncbi:MAG: ATP-binding cassette domain-containing protein [Nitrospirae bacterium]|nr:ATP-binding cassette domain-containing protein [Nitrospirota bacterium]